jgi:hypothetical protein
MLTCRKHSVQEYLASNCEINSKTGCWVWKKCKDKNGYGKACFNSIRIRAHRLSYSTYKGEIQHAEIVCHTCDNPACINPAHLFKGDTKTNVQDKVLKGRQPKGEQITNSKLTAEQVIRIRKLRETLTLNQLSQLYKVSKSNLSDICNRHIWKHL